MNRTIFVFYIVQVEGPGIARGKKVEKKTLNKTLKKLRKKF